MKQYIKPQTEITIVKARTAMLQASALGVDSTKETLVGGGDAKERDVWNDGFWD